MHERPPAKVHPRVLVLLAAYNGEAWIGRQLASVLAQKDVDLEILVSDDASNDGTLAIVQSAARMDPRVMWTRQSVGSGHAAGNFMHLLREADARAFTHVALCDQDDTWDPAKLGIACLLLNETGAGLYSAATMARWPDGRTALLRQCDQTTRADFLFEGAGQGCTFVLSTALFARVQSFVRAHRAAVAFIHYHDWLIYALTRVWGFAWIHDPRPCLEYRQHASNDTGARSGSAGWRRRLALIRSGWYRRQVQSVLEACRAAGTHLEVERVHRLMAASSMSFGDRMRWALYLLRHGRRRLVDRVVLCLSAWAGDL